MADASAAGSGDFPPRGSAGGNPRAGAQSAARPKGPPADWIRKISALPADDGDGGFTSATGVVVDVAGPRAPPRLFARLCLLGLPPAGAAAGGTAGAHHGGIGATEAHRLDLHARLSSPHADVSQCAEVE